MSGWTAPARTPEALKAYAAAEADRAVRPDRYQLGADAVEIVIDRGTRREGAGVLGDADQWRPGLLHYLVSAEEDGRLNALGALTAQRTAAGRLAARAAITRYLHEHPDTEHRSLNPPIIITGGWRTGTTFLFRLLDRDPRLRAPLPAELGMPWRLPGTLEADERARRLEAAAAGPYMLHVLNPAMAAVHDSGPNLPEECVLGMGTTLRNWGFTATTRLDGYATWLAGQDFTAEYAQHRRMLQILDAGDGRRWVLKAPAHTAELRHVIATYPGACIVQLHRDIVETVASGASLFATYRSTYSDHVDGADVGPVPNRTDRTVAAARCGRPRLGLDRDLARPSIHRPGRRPRGDGAPNLCRCADGATRPGRNARRATPRPTSPRQRQAQLPARAVRHRPRRVTRTHGLLYPGPRRL